MIFLGDIASPAEGYSNDLYDSLNESLHLFKDDIVVANFEGLISDDIATGNQPILNNHPSVLRPLQLVNTKAVSLANNHTLDLPHNLDRTTAFLSDNGIKYFGAGREIKQAEEPAVFEHDGYTYFILGYSWDILMQHQKNEPGVMYVSTIKPKQILEKIRSIRQENPNAKIVLKMHWSFDLENIPFPLYRKFSRAMIDAGANAVIGEHSHCVQGGERYKDGVIVYGLGNFFFPWFVFRNGKSRFPEWTRTELAVQWDPKTNTVKCHWFKYVNNGNRHKLEYLSTEDFDTGTLINEYSPYRTMNEREYLNYYRKNRRKGFLMPIYKDHNDTLRNGLIDFYIKKRIKFARFLTHNLNRKTNK